MICDCGGCYACGLRAKGVQLSPAATPRRKLSRNPVVRPMTEPSWEGAPVYDERPGGYRMPILAPGSVDRPMTIKERSDIGVRKVNEGLNRLRQDPNVFANP